MIIETTKYSSKLIKCHSNINSRTISNKVLKICLWTIIMKWTDLSCTSIDKNRRIKKTGRTTTRNYKQKQISHIACVSLFAKLSKRIAMCKIGETQKQGTTKWRPHWILLNNRRSSNEVQFLCVQMCAVCNLLVLMKCIQSKFNRMTWSLYFSVSYFLLRPQYPIALIRMHLNT